MTIQCNIWQIFVWFLLQLVDVTIESRLIQDQLIIFLTLSKLMPDLSRTFDQFRTTIMSNQNSPQLSSKLKFISPDKWKSLMLKSLETVAEFNYADKDLIHDLRFIITNISEDKFIQAILSIEPFKPKFKPMKLLDSQGQSSKSFLKTPENNKTVNNSPKTILKKEQSIIQKGSLILQRKHSAKKQKGSIDSMKESKSTSPSTQKDSILKQYLQVIIQQEALKKEFEKKYHPFKKIMDSFVFILQNKYKNMIDTNINKTLQTIQQLITFDVLVMQKLLVKIAQPYMSIFQSENSDEVILFKKKMQTFMKQYVNNNPKINQAIRKVMRHYARQYKPLLKLQSGIEDFIQIDEFHIDDDFKIEGCYVQAMSTLMEFAQCPKAYESLVKLQEFRAAIAKDVDDYYELTGQQKQRQINAQVQIQIVRFVICKLKGWIPEIFAQLKYLQIIYGDEEIAYKYDDASYIYAQLITVFDSLQAESVQSEMSMSLTFSESQQSKIMVSPFSPS